MIDDPEVLNRKAAWLDTLRGRYRNERTSGFVLVAVGFAMLVWDRLNGAMSKGPLIAAGVLLVVGWCCLFYSLIQRRRWAAAHPFDPNA